MKFRTRGEQEAYEVGRKGDPADLPQEWIPNMARGSMATIEYCQERLDTGDYEPEPAEPDEEFRRTEQHYRNQIAYHRGFLSRLD